jgi:hypothetical protein
MAKAGGYLGHRVAAAERPAPILRTAHHGQVVSHHRAIDMEDRIAERTNTPAHLWFLARYQPLIETAYFFEDGASNERISATEV